MMANVQVRPMTLEEFLALPQGPPYYEFEEGEMIPLASPTIRHQDICDELVFSLKQFVRPRNIGRIIREVDVVLPSGRVLVPDIVFVSEPRLALLMPTDKRLEGAPDLVVEITSSDSERDRVDKFKTYFENGVEWYWIVDRETLEVEEYRAGRTDFELKSLAESAETFRSTLFDGLEVNLARKLAE